jgi:hypothetical protein
MDFSRGLVKLFILSLLLLLASCGGGGGSDESSQQKYSLGGRISWALFPGLVLSDGTGNTFSVDTGAPGSGSFSFNSGNPYLDAGTSYKVTVQSHPEGLTCTVTNGTGTISDNVNDVLVTCEAPTAHGLNWLAPSWPYSSYYDMVKIGSTMIFNYSRHGYTLDLSSAGGVIQPLIIQNGPGGADLWSSVFPSSVAADVGGDVYFAYTDSGNPYCKVLKLTATATPGTYVGSTLAGTTCGYTDGPGITSQFGNISGLAVDSAGNVFVADSDNNVIRKITPSGDVSTWVGSGSQASVDGSGISASFDFSFYAGCHILAMDNDDNLYVAEFNSGKIRKVSPGGEVTTIATGIHSNLLTTDTAGNMYVVETDGNATWQSIRRITPSGSVTTLVAHGAVHLPTWNDPSVDEGLGLVNSLIVDSMGKIYTAGFTSLYEIILP